MSTSDSGRTDFFEVGDRSALICTDPLTGESVQASMHDLGYKTHTVETSEMAIDRIRYTTYDCIILHENFAGSSLKSNALLSFLSQLPMAQRRNSFVCLIGSSFKTLDAMQAFAQSVYLVVNPVDLPNLTAILKKSIVDFELLYRVYHETLRALGEQ